MRPVRITLDTNCLINLQDNTGQHLAIQELIDAHRARRVVLCVTAMAASENQLGGRPRTNHGEFKEWLKELGLEDVEEILPMGHWGISFWDHAVYAGPELVAQEEAIHKILHPTIPVQYSEFCAARGLDPVATPMHRRWLNAKCDVQAMWSHIQAGNDVFVTEDKRFLQAARRSALIVLGAGRVLTPLESVDQLLSGPRAEKS